MKLTRREFLKSAAGIAGIVSLSASLESCITNSNNDYAELKYALRDRWNNISYENKRKTIEFWDKDLDEKDRKKFLQIYNHTEKEYAKVNNETKKRINDFLRNIKNPSFKETKDYKDLDELITNCPWVININDVRKSDLIFIDYILSMVFWGG